MDPNLFLFDGGPTGIVDLARVEAIVPLTKVIGGVAGADIYTYGGHRLAFDGDPSSLIQQWKTVMTELTELESPPASAASAAAPAAPNAPESGGN